MIGCSCKVCTSTNPKNRRYRTAVFVREGDASVLIDAPPELRLQLIENGITHTDAVLFTHTHADHVFGLDDIRRINDLSGKAMPIYGEQNVLDDIKRVFQYAFMPTQHAGGKPNFNLRTINEPFNEPFGVNGLQVEALRVFHGGIPILAFRFGGFAYVTDVSRIPQKSVEQLRGLDFLVLDALRFNRHPTHFNLEQALEVVSRIKPKRTALTHLSHDFDHDEVNKILPPGVELAYDGMKVTI
jgi:phosphoribosyl 1,2-cyclic phosphate phosphodiesterase